MSRFLRRCAAPAEEVTMASIPVDIVDAFAERPFTGNPAAIVPDATDLSEAAMLQLTDELQMEAGFVLPPTRPDADLRLRFFTPRREATLSGHVIVAAFTSLVDRGIFQPVPEGLALRQETRAGVLPVVLTAHPPGPVEVTFDLLLPRFGEPVPAAQVAAALGLSPAICKFDEHRPQRISCGFDTLVVPITDFTAARGVLGDMEAIRRLADSLGVGGIACFCTEVTSPDVDLYCRFFFPSEGKNEDVVSATSLGAIAAYCLDKGVIPRGPQVRIVSEQGHALGRPNRAEVRVHMDDRRITRVSLTATGSVVLRGEFELLEARAAVGG
jgi:trans-2,3-dihydro-3-hydroxyanthranilate isomerase